MASDKAPAGASPADYLVADHLVCMETFIRDAFFKKEQVVAVFGWDSPMVSSE